MEYVPLSLPCIGQEEIDAVTEVMRSGWLTTGKEVHAFEEEFAESVGAPYAVALNSCTAALHLAYEALGVQGMVVTTPYTFAASAEILTHCHKTLVPEFIDIDAGTLNLDLMKVSTYCHHHKVAVVAPVHFGGCPVDLERLYELADTHELHVVEDCAHIGPAYWRTKQVGSTPDREKWQGMGAWAACFSFYVTKPITTGEGGMFVTDDEAYADEVRLLSLHGMSKDAWNRNAQGGSWKYEVTKNGYKYNMTDTAAAMGRVQLRKSDEMWGRRAKLARRYSIRFEGVEELQVPYEPDEATSSWHLYPLRLNLAQLAISRDVFIEELRARGVGAGQHFVPLTMQPWYQKAYRLDDTSCPVAYRESRREVSLPLWAGMTDEQHAFVVEKVLQTVKDFKEG